jgi:hypothetical protein
MPKKPSKDRELAVRAEERRKDVGDHLKRLGGRTRDDVTGDLTRGAASPIGHGEIAERRKRK